MKRDDRSCGSRECKPSRPGPVCLSVSALSVGNWLFACDLHPPAARALGSCCDLPQQTRESSNWTRSALDLRACARAKESPPPPGFVTCHRSCLVPLVRWLGVLYIYLHVCLLLSGDLVLPRWPRLVCGKAVRGWVSGKRESRLHSHADTYRRGSRHWGATIGSSPVALKWEYLGIYLRAMLWAAGTREECFMLLGPGGGLSWAEAAWPHLWLADAGLDLGCFTGGTGGKTVRLNGEMVIQWR